MSLPGFDVSHYQAPVDYAAAKRAGMAFVVLKATESTNYNDPTFTDSRAKAHAAGLGVGAYHFARAGDPLREADWFCKTVGTLAAGEFVVLDWEVAASNPPGWCLAWLDRVHATLGVKPLIYMNQSTRDGYNWSRVVAAGYPLWLAKYDNSPAKPTGGDWPSVAMKQYSSSGGVAGVRGPVDVDAFYGTTADLAALGRNTPSTDWFATVDEKTFRAILADELDKKLDDPHRADKFGNRLLDLFQNPKATTGIYATLKQILGALPKTPPAA